GAVPVEVSCMRPSLSSALRRSLEIPRREAGINQSDDGRFNPLTCANPSGSRCARIHLDGRVDSAGTKPASEQRILMFLAIRDIRFAKGRFALMGSVVALITLLLVM